MHRRIPRKLRPAIFASLLVGAAVYADISPTEYIASGITPKSDSTVRMEKAHVEIVWAAPVSLAPPCTLSATFTMANRTPATQELTIGFPMPARRIPKGKEADPMTMSFDGTEAAVTPPTQTQTDFDSGEWVWYTSKHSFRPGKTEVVVKTNLRASLVYGGPFRESLFYCIETGGKWAGNIGEEVVVIRFPSPPEKGQIIEATPAGYQIDGNCVRWRFTDFKPKGKEFDIKLTYVRPDVMQVIAALREEVRHTPASSAAAVKLARHLLVLGYAKSNSGYPPSRLTSKQHETILLGIASPPDRKIFMDHYKAGAAGGYAEVDSEWTDERTALIQILADVGYRTEDSQHGFVREAEDLLHDVLKRDPHDADAWNVYLSNYWRFSFAAIGHWFGPTRLSRSQARAIESAAANCPNDPTIRAWLEYVHATPEKRDTRRLLDAIKSQNSNKLDFPKIGYGYM